jgi:hypothetical protein
MEETCPKEPQWSKEGTGIESPEVPTGSRKENGTPRNFSFVFNLYWILTSKWKHTINVMVTCLQLIASLQNKAGCKKVPDDVVEDINLEKKRRNELDHVEVEFEDNTSDDVNDDDDDEEEEEEEEE